MGEEEGGMVDGGWLMRGELKNVFVSINLGVYSSSL
jgi:hypothetical protein